MRALKGRTEARLRDGVRRRAGAEASMHERHAARAAALLADGKRKAAAEAFNEAAELAMEACNGRLAQLYYEKAAAAEADAE